MFAELIVKVSNQGDSKALLEFRSTYSSFSSKIQKSKTQ
jgi:hypothetical protein